MKYGWLLGKHPQHYFSTWANIFPYITKYAATKTFLIAFSEELALEIQNQGVTIQGYYQGFTDTDSHQTVGHRPKHILFVQSAQQVVKTSLHALQSKRTLITIG